MRPKLGASRSVATRSALLDAFRDLLFAGGFDNVSVQAIAATAEVSRSTFYEHFGGKEDILRASMSPFFATIADSVCRETEPEHLGRILAHLWENRRLANAIFSGTSRVILAQALSEMVETRLRNMHDGARLLLPYRLASIQLAETQLALVENWLRGRAHCKVADLSRGLHRTSRMTALALVV